MFQNLYFQRFPEPIIGFKDSCSGDSGGPLWKVEGQENRAVVIGLTSRGASICGQVDRPAIYTRIKAHLKWIHDTLDQLGSSASVWHLGMFSLWIGVVTSWVNAVGTPFVLRACA